MTSRIVSLSTAILILLISISGQAQNNISRMHSEAVRKANATVIPARSHRSTKQTVQSQLDQLRIDMRDELNSMSNQIESLKQQLAESKQQATRAQQTAEVATLAVTEAQQAVQADQKAVAASNDSVNDLRGAVSEIKTDGLDMSASVKKYQLKTTADIQNPIAIRYKGVALTPGGFIAAESVWRQHSLQADIASPFNSIPFSNMAMADLTEFRVSARQSRMNLLASSQVGNAAISGYFEFDLLGAGLTSNSTESNSYIPRLRHAWVQATWKNGWSLTAGQMWTLAQPNRKGINSLVSNVYLPDMIDAQYVVGVNWLRQPSFRVVRNFNDRLLIAASVEGAQTMYSARNAPSNFLFGSPGTSVLTSTVNYTFDKAPDVIVKIAADPGFGHYELKGIARFFRDRVYPGAPSSVGAYNSDGVGAGAGAAASWNFAKKVDFSLSALAGNGVGRYGTSQLPDVTVRPNGTLALIRGGQALGTLEFNPNLKLKIYAYGGAEYAGRTAFLNSSGLGVGYGSPLNDNTGCHSETVPTSSTTPTSGKCTADTRAVDQAVVGFWYRPYVGPLGRLQYGLQYSYTARSTWSGLGGAPKANESMIFTSMRYYLP